MASNVSRLLFRHFDTNFNNDGNFRDSVFTPHRTMFTTVKPTNGTLPLCGKDDENDTSTMLYAIIALLLLNITLHTTGCSLLYQTLNHTKGYVQQLFILNLSLSELFKNVCKLVRYIAKLILEMGSVGGIVFPHWCALAVKVTNMIVNVLKVKVNSALFQLSAT